MKTIFAIGLAPGKHQTLLRHLLSRFRVITFRGNYDWRANNPGIEYAEELLQSQDLNISEERITNEINSCLEFTKSQVQKLTGTEKNFISDTHINAITERGKQAIVSASIFQTLANKHHIDLVICNADYSGLRRPIVLAAKEIGIPTFDVEHGFFSQFPEPQAYKPGFKPVYWFTSDYVNLDNAIEKELIELYGKESENSLCKLLANGTPNDITVAETISRESAIEYLHLNPNKFTITLAGSWTFAVSLSDIVNGFIEQAEFYKTALESLSKIDNRNQAQIIIKVHPMLGQAQMFGDAAKYLQRIANENGFDTVMITASSLDYVLAASDFVICPNHSSVVWESILANTPAAVLLPERVMENVFYKEKLSESNLLCRRGLMRHLLNEDDVVQSVNFYMNHQNRDEFRNKVRELLDEKQIKNQTADEKSQNICNCISEILGDSKPVANINSESKTVTANSTEIPSYYTFSRPEVQALVPTSARKILDVGCAAGALGKALKESRKCEVVGVEPVAEAASLAQSVLDRVYNCGVEESIHLLEDSYFDCIIMADVLEHLIDPESVLKTLKQKLAPGGCFVISVPNVRHWSVLRSLLEGRWDYADAGLLDRTHLRFFTRSSFEALLDRAGLQPKIINGTAIKGEEMPQDLLESFSNAGINVNSLGEESKVYQYLYTAEPIAYSAEDHLTSIIILTRNQLEYTRLCLESIQKHTPEPHELIIVDNASTDGTVEYIKKLERERSNVRIFLNKENSGFAAGNNIGISMARGDRILLLNNDTVVTPGWLERLLKCAERYSDAGIVGPMTNNISGPQKLAQAAYDTSDLNGLDKFALQWGEQHSGEHAVFWRVVGFCMLIKREVIEEIGGLDPRFGLGNYEDDDFCIRSAIAGYKSIIAFDSFIHHFGSKTFAAEKLDYKEAMMHNWEIFRQKWNIVWQPGQPLQYDVNKLISQRFDPKLHKIPIDLQNADEEEEAHSIEGMGSIRYLEDYIKNNPDDLNAINALALAYDAIGETDKCENLLRKMIEISNNSPVSIYGLSAFLHKQNRFRESAEYACRAAELCMADENLLELLRSLRKHLSNSSKTNKKKKAKANADSIIRKIDSSIVKVTNEINEKSKKRRSSTKPKLSLCMIAKDEENFIGKCLESVKDVVDEIILVDTGSKDKTIEIAKSYGAKIYHKEWQENYSDAKNEAIKYATGNWILTLDADEILDPNSKQLLIETITNPDADGYELMFKNYHLDDQAPDLVHRVCRLHINNPAYRYEGRVHENIVQSITNSGGIVKKLDVVVHHYGYKPEVMKQKNKHERYLKLLLAELEDKPDDLYVLHHLCAAFTIQQDFENAIYYLEKMASKIQPWHSFANHTFSRLANAYWATNRPDQALRALARAEELGLRHPELTFIKANVYLQKRDFHKAIKLFKDTIVLGKQQDWDGDARICGFKSQFGLASAYLGIGDYENAIKHAHNTMNEYPEHPQAPEVLALAYDALKQYENAEKYWRMVRKINPDHPVPITRLAEIYERLERFADAAEQYKDLMGMQGETPEMRMKIAECYGNAGRFDVSEAEYLKVIKLQPDCVEAYTNLGLVRAALGKYSDALESFCTAIKIDPEYANAYFNAGDLLYALGQYEKAAEMYMSGIDKRPDHAAAYFTLGNCRFQLGDYNGAANAYRQALEIKPDYFEAINNLSLAEEELAKAQAA